LKNPTQKGAGGVAQSVGPEFKPQHHKEKKKKKNKSYNNHKTKNFWEFTGETINYSKGKM
jgi:hypothetical protein